MLQRSPILRFALEVLQHALECYCRENSRDKKMATLHLALSIELSVKAALVEKNVSIYEKSGNRTINPHEALTQLAKAWSMERIEKHSQIELLIDERNAIQHRYASVDDITLDYHMQTTFDVLSNILKIEFDTELEDWIKDNVDQKVWEKVRFVTGEDSSDQTPSDAIIEDRSPALDFVDGFSRYERQFRVRLAELTGRSHFNGSTLDVMLKLLANWKGGETSVIKALPTAYRIRNKVVHGEVIPSSEEVKAALGALDRALAALSEAPDELVLKVVRASEAGVRGTTLKDDDASDGSEPDA